MKGLSLLAGGRCCAGAVILSWLGRLIRLPLLQRGARSALCWDGLSLENAVPEEQGAQSDCVLSPCRTTPRSSCALSWLLSRTLMRTGTSARTS